MSKVVQTQQIASFESSSSRGKFYEVQANHTDDGHAYLSCNCMSWTTSSANKGKQAWERTCKHTDRAVSQFASKIRLFDDLLSARVEWWLRGSKVSSQLRGAGKPAAAAPAPVAKPKANPGTKDRTVAGRFDALEL